MPKIIGVKGPQSVPYKDLKAGDLFHFGSIRELYMELDEGHVHLSSGIHYSDGNIHPDLYVFRLPKGETIVLEQE